jgi:hypothetical protein
MAMEYLMIRDGAPECLQPVSEGLKGFLSEKSHQVQQLVKVIGDRLHHLICPSENKNRTGRSKLVIATRE